MERIITSGKRKSAIARAILTEGIGEVTINGIDYQNLQMFDRLKIEEPIRIYEKMFGKKNFNIKVNIKGGGEKGQIEAARLSIARALVIFSKTGELRKHYLEYDKHLLVADVRRKETYKPGDSKARKKRQSSKR